jgi:hypothetical protein
MKQIEEVLWGKHHDRKGYDLPLRNKCFGGQAVNVPDKCLCEGGEREWQRKICDEAEKL